MAKTVWVKEGSGTTTRIWFGCDAPAHQVFGLLSKMQKQGSDQFTDIQMYTEDVPPKREPEEVRRAMGLVELLFAQNLGEA